MRRRYFVTGLGAASLAACQEPQTAGTTSGSNEIFEWKMVTTWPPNFPGLGTGAVTLADSLHAASGGRLRVKVYAGGELVPPFEVFDAVSSGAADMGHSGAYYWKGKSEAAQFFSTIPFGMNAAEMNGWLYYGGGLELWRELYEPFDLVPFPVGNSGVQMGGWFNKEINTVADLKGLKMRIPGLGGEVLTRAGGTTVNLPGAEIYTALQTGSIDATEWVGPYNDMAFGLHQAARYYYYPGWHEPGSNIECMVNKTAYDSLPPELRALIGVACMAANTNMLAEFTARNHASLTMLQASDDIEIRRFPEAVLRHLKVLSVEVIEELAARDEVAGRVWDSYRRFQERAAEWQRVSEEAFFATRYL